MKKEQKDIEKEQEQIKKPSKLSRAANITTVPARYPGYTLMAVGTLGLALGVYLLRNEIHEFLDSIYIHDAANIMKHSADLTTESREVLELTIDNLLQNLDLPKLDTLNNRLLEEYSSIVEQLETTIGEVGELPGQVGDYADEFKEKSGLLYKAKGALDALIRNETELLNQLEDSLEAIDQLHVDVGQTLEHIGKETKIHWLIEKFSIIEQKIQGQDKDYLGKFVERITDLTLEKEQIQEVKKYADQLRAIIQNYKALDIAEAEQTQKLLIEAGDFYRKLVELKELTRGYSPDEYTPQIQQMVEQSLESLNNSAHNELQKQVASAVEVAMESRDQFYLDQATMHVSGLKQKLNFLLYTTSAVAEAGVIGVSLYVESIASKARKAGRLAVNAANKTAEAASSVGKGIYNVINPKGEDKK